MKKYIKYIITFLLCSIVAITIMFTKGIQEKDSLRDVMHILVDSFFVPGIVMSGFGLLVLCSNGGTFDMLTYGLRKMLFAFKRDLSNEKYKTFYEYRMAKASSPRPYLYLVIVGCFFILLSCIFLVIYYNA